MNRLWFVETDEVCKSSVLERQLERLTRVVYLSVCLFKCVCIYMLLDRLRWMLKPDVSHTVF